MLIRHIPTDAKLKIENSSISDVAYTKVVDFLPYFQVISLHINSPNVKMIHVPNIIKHDDNSESKEIVHCLYYSQVQF